MIAASTSTDMTHAPLETARIDIACAWIVAVPVISRAIIVEPFILWQIALSSMIVALNAIDAITRAVMKSGTCETSRFKIGRAWM